MHGEGGGSRVLPVRVIPQVIQQLLSSFCHGHPEGDVLGNKVLAKRPVHEAPRGHPYIGVW